MTLKILQITDSLTSGGKERQLVELLTYLSIRKDVTCELIIMSHDVHYTYINDLNVKTYQVIREFSNRFQENIKKIYPFFINSMNCLKKQNRMLYIHGILCVLFMQYLLQSY